MQTLQRWNFEKLTKYHFPTYNTVERVSKTQMTDYERQMEVAKSVNFAISQRVVIDLGMF